jgi:PAS domain S-box-containing protein
VSEPGVQIDSQTEAFRRQVAQFFEVTSDAIFFLDSGYRFTFLNERARQIMLPVQDVLGRNLYECFPAAKDPKLPFAASFNRSLVEKLPADFEANYPEPLNITVRGKSFPAADGIVVFFHDITKQKLDAIKLEATAAELSQQHAELETIYRTAPIGLALFDLNDYHYIRLNDRQAAFFGMRPEEVIGRTLTELAPIEGVREMFDRVAAGEPIINAPIEGRLVNDPPETHRYWTVSYFPVFGPDGSIRAITAASLEITQQKKAEQALIQSEKLALVGRMASSIAHEINNPLESVTNLLYLAGLSETLDETREYIRIAERELGRVSAIANQTLRFHKQASSPQEISANALVESALGIFQGRIASSFADVHQRLRAERPIRCFEGEIRQVLSNLVGNALDALIQQEGKIFLRTREATHWKTGERGIIVTIADNGSGMSEQTQAKIYEAFFTTKGVTGTGLGLWVSKEIIDRHRGALYLRSSQSQTRHGTVFALFLPFSAEQQ